MGYEHEIFLSYPRKARIFEQWVLTRFKPFLEDYLGSELGYMPRVFVDQINIVPGESWPDRLRFALARSRCLVAIFTPLYFSSEWCCREFAAMRHRGQRLGLTSADNPTGLAIPVNLWDGDSFPSCVGDLHHLDCRPYMFVGKCFEDSDLFLEFQQKLQGWIPKVAGLVRNTPDWSQQWTTTDWLDVPYQELLIPTPKIGQPRMT